MNYYDILVEMSDVEIVGNENVGFENMRDLGMIFIVFFAVANAKYNFLYVNAGCQGRISDGGVFKNTQLYKKLEKNGLSLPPAEPLNGREKSIPFFFLGDEAFALAENLMKPFPGLHTKGSVKRVYNYRLCRARPVVENVFGTSSAVFRVLRKPLLLEPGKAELIVMTIAYLHNFLKRSCNSCNVYTPPGTFDTEVDGRLIEGSCRRIIPNDETMTSLLPLRNVPRRSCKRAQEIQEELAEYFHESPTIFAPFGISIPGLQGFLETDVELAQLIKEIFLCCIPPESQYRNNGFQV
ncbi:unnamed protein product [Acanthoscelides obtectus]|uniref:DDE Tnp4 domain-containing protein n=1 Tax=Acanthoscelides obtectus TaxID=200917 RepID=A0A9P0KN87_ACAOB|nr:unnamed protein product [Acanthoscelides obtectus]CAK1640124.1 hypothetical protein AOBTE_LOCUS11555 [Acanthoscelides obtectus]